MGQHELRSFFLYSSGLHRELLTLGSLLWADYANPEVAKRWSAPYLSDDDLAKCAYVTEYSDYALVGRQKSGGGFEVQTIVGPTFSADLSRPKDRIVVAERGRKAILKDPIDYLDKLLSADGQGGRERLQLWLSAAKSAYYLHGHWVRRPKVWVLTGFYEMTNARFQWKSSSSVKLGVGVDAATVGLLTGVPIGAGVHGDVGSSTTAGAVSQGAQIWAAQYRMLDLKYVHAASHDTDSLKVIKLLPNVYSRGTLRSAEDDSLNAVEQRPGLIDDEDQEGVLTKDATDEDVAKCDADFDEMLEELEEWVADE